MNLLVFEQNGQSEFVKQESSHKPIQGPKMKQAPKTPKSNNNLPKISKWSAASST